VAITTVPLVTDPDLRAALRQLYPECPPWARAWLIAPPEQALLPPDDTPEGERTITANLLAEMRETCEAINATAPRQPWQLHQNGHITWIGPDGSAFKHRTRHPKAVGRIITIRTFDPDGPRGSGLGPHVFEATWREARGSTLATIAAHAPLRWAHYRGPITLHGHIGLDGRIAERRLVIQSKEGLAEHGILGVPFADGSPGVLALTNGCPLAEQQMRASITSTDYQAGARALLQRWHALSSNDARQRIAQFWLGHPHPALALAGLAIATDNALLRESAHPTPTH
jgi:hypothetical protein